MKIHMLRLKPSEDIKASLLNFTRTHHIQSAIIVSAVGSTKQLRVRINDGETIKETHELMELVQLSGTITDHHIHAHILGIDHEMRTFGGHLCDGCLVHTTLELSLLDLSERYENKRIFDEETGYSELHIERKQVV